MGAVRLLHEKWEVQASEDAARDDRHAARARRARLPLLVVDHLEDAVQLVIGMVLLGVAGYVVVTPSATCSRATRHLRLG